MFFREAKVKRIQYHQTSLTTNVGDLYSQEIQERGKKKKRSTKSTPNN